MKDSDKLYWSQGAHQKLPGNPTQPKPAFAYDQVLKQPADELHFNADNWNDFMLSPLRELLGGMVLFGTAPAGWSVTRQQGAQPEMFLKDDRTVSVVAYVDPDGQNSAMIRYATSPHSYEVAYVTWYKNHGRTEKIVDLEGLPLDLAELNRLYHALEILD